MIRRAWNWKEASLEKGTVSELAFRFEVGLYDAALAGNPADIELLATLADIYAKRGLHEKGLEIDLKLVQIRPKEAVFHYKLACSHSLLGHIDPAFQALTQALQLGYNKIDHLRQNPDLDNLKKDSRYREILETLHKQSKKIKG
jgi:hypothetical protein